MKNKISVVLPVIILFLMSSIAVSQHKKGELQSKYATIITLHGVEGADFEEWLKNGKIIF